MNHLYFVCCLGIHVFGNQSDVKEQFKEMPVITNPTSDDRLHLLELLFDAGLVNFHNHEETTTQTTNVKFPYVGLCYACS